MSITTLTPGKRVQFKKSGGALTVQFTASAVDDRDVVLMGMYELADGSTGVVHVWDWRDVRIGHLHEPPFVSIPAAHLPSAKGQVTKQIGVSLEHATQVRRLVIFAAMRRKGLTWSDARCPAVNIFHPRHGFFDFQLGYTWFGLPNLRRYRCRTCVLATLDFDADGAVALTPRDAYFTGVHQQVADAYNLDMTFTSEGILVKPSR